MQHVAEHREQKAIEKWVYIGGFFAVVLVARLICGLVDAVKGAPRSPPSDE
jgi:hypothetical protein